MADGTAQGDVDPAGLTAPSELHLELAPNDATASSSGGMLGELAGWPWWYWLAGGLVLYLILRR